MLEGRMINVELTAGGGGKGENRLEKLKKRNQELLGQRASFHLSLRIELLTFRSTEQEGGPEKQERWIASFKTRQTPAVLCNIWY